LAACAQSRKRRYSISTFPDFMRRVAKTCHHPAVKTTVGSLMDTCGSDAAAPEPTSISGADARQENLPSAKGSCAWASAAALGRTKASEIVNADLTGRFCTGLATNQAPFRRNRTTRSITKSRTIVASRISIQRLVRSWLRSWYKSSSVLTLPSMVRCQSDK